MQKVFFLQRTYENSFLLYKSAFNCIVEKYCENRITTVCLRKKAFFNYQLFLEK